MCNLASFNKAEDKPKKHVEVDGETLEGYNVQDVPLLIDDPIDIEDMENENHQGILGVSEEVRQPVLDDGYGLPDGDLTMSQYSDNYYRDDDYSDYDYDYDYRPDMIEEPCCFWPWFAKSKQDDETNISDPSVPFRQFSRNVPADLLKRGNQPDSTEVERTSSSFLESAPSSPTTSMEAKVDCDDTDAAAGSGPAEFAPLPSHTAKPKKSILKRSSTAVPPPSNDSRRTIMSNSNGSLPDKEPARRRSLFANTYESGSSKKKPSHVRFSPMAKVTYVVSCTEMSLLFKSFIWWQRSDFEEFKKTARMIAKAMLTGGSEIWLSTSDVWHVPKGRRDTTTITTPVTTTADEDNLDNNGADDAHGQKWWCKFGHSRRGLEHIVCQNEGRQRQQNVALAISAVIGEYARQKHLHTNDDARLASVSARYTSWARDLALAAGLADADAVRQNFGPQARPRSYFLGTAAAHSTAALQLAHSQGHNTVTAGHLMASLTSSEFSPTILDANTHSHVVTVSGLPKTTVKRPTSEDDKNKKIAKSAAAFGGNGTNNLLIVARS